ncbi:hypothetical protein [Mycolicibacterium brisbanense]|uniref:Alkaline shock response membrane anchor protein AmaP n=1 Tax=Mycolicibacterium brisbanense TaxID=146020 RepID=A0A117I5D3_9MYCO|nr:hypothetical protein [Mycolicibacterium brisbanense]MCV7161943.1 hypothetical protein [Mycolicibacterium brisbanense]GAS88352.1 uncharacterized protein RMCB_2448 [Mycolicibacterium brisbanense]
MTPTLRVVDRLLTGLVAAMLLGGSVWLIGYGANVAAAHRAAERLDPGAIGAVGDWHWWPTVLGAAGVVAVLLGTWLVLLHLRPRTVRSLQTSSGAVDLARIAQAAAEDLGRHPAVQFSKGVTRAEGGRPIVRVSVGVAPSTPSAEIRRLARRVGADVRSAAAGDVDVQVVIAPVAAHKVRSQVT